MSIKSFLKRQIKKVLRREPPAAPPVVPVSRHQGKAPHTLADVVEHYEKYTSVYHEVCGEVFQAGRPTSVDELLSHEFGSAQIADGQRILDAGCGVGGPAIWLARHKQVTIDAVTISPMQLTLGRQTVEAAQLGDRVKVHLGDYHKLEDLFPANTFDTVYFLESICHAENYERVLASAWKVLKPGGSIYIKDYLERDFSHDPSTKVRADEFLKKVYAEYSWSLVQRHEMTAMIEKTGFQIELFEPIPFTHDKEDHSFQLEFEKKVGFHWRDGIDIWIIESFEVRARKPSQ